ncbi:hypothetical protein [Pseudonocardia cypriaca]|uniref:4-amino-4-deoxy-L-arabinose transferase-like glycosyltransferase n=1 Tax=Pseudonocardia cypriaca TaxID=882449 RepID=A0A543FYB3_9PSEU|nr:hypothetical protein [Pseudonocardia cypriaca]TQM38818.1 hypothetical protein FB388_6062 [Pseudonocardia cypriaca]
MPMSVRPGLRLDGAVIWLVLTAATVGALYSSHFLPFYDYYQWLFQGHVVADLLFGGADATGFAGAYSLDPVPVPNLAAPLGIGALNVFLPIEAAGQLFVVLTVLGFAGSFGYLVRTLQGRPTAIEYLGFLWAPGFYLYKGYLSFMVGMALVFVVVAVLHQAVAAQGGPGRRTLVLLGVLGVVLYLSHLLAWGIGVLAVLVHVLVLARTGRGRRALPLVGTVLPGVVLAAWYVLAEHGGTGVVLYTSWFDKAISLSETLQPFLRLDPFPPVFPIFWVNVLLVLVFAALVLFQLDRSALRAAFEGRPVLWLAGLLVGIALVLPVSMVNDLIKPDERFVMPALLLAVAALPYRAVRPAATGVTAVLVVAVLGLHAVEYVDVGGRIARVDAATDAAVPAGAPLLYLTVPSRYGCEAAPGLSVGVPVLKWFGVDHAIETGQARVNVEETSIVRAEGPAEGGMTVLAPTLAEVPGAVLPIAADHPYVQAIACPSDLAGIEQELGPAYRPVAHGEGYTILRRTS